MHANDPSKSSLTKFQQALLASDEDDWTWGEHETFDNISKQDLMCAEGDYQRAFDSINNGFNSKMEDNTLRSSEERGGASSRLWKSTHQEESRAYARQYHASHQEQRHEYYLKNKERYKEDNKKRRAKVNEDPELLAARRERDRTYYQKRKAEKAATSTSSADPDSS